MTGCSPDSGPALLLAPMEGMTDFVMRDVLTRLGGYERCVAEFIRVTGTLLPARTFYATLPELRHGSRTAAGVPVRAQLLGSDASCLADNAARLAELGAEGVDINFGCPAAIVNRHGGGAALLKEPERMERIVAAMRRAVPAHVPVSAKMRLGYDDASVALDCALAAQQGGACELVVHARTKADGYRPPAYWAQIAPLRAALSIAVIANGEIWTVADAARARAESGCNALMLGRGAVADPGLAHAIRSGGAHSLPWGGVEPLLQRFWDMVCAQLTPGQRAGRLKQWLNLLRRRYPEAEVAFQHVRTITDQRLITQWIEKMPASA